MTEAEREARQHAYTRASYYRHREVRLAKKAAWSKANRERVNAATAAYALRNPEKRRAYHVLHYALKTGRLVRRPCEVCGSERSDAHHDNYALPLEVRWLCRAHHKALHASCR